jgi:hypothetical protein
MPLYVFEMWGGVDSECGERVMSVVVKCGTFGRVKMGWDLGARLLRRSVGWPHLRVFCSWPIRGAEKCLKTRGDKLHSPLGTSSA